MIGEKNIITEPETSTQYRNCIFSPVVTFQHVIFLHVYAWGRPLITLPSLTSLIKNQSWRRGGEPTGFLLYTCKGEKALNVLSLKKFGVTRLNLKYGSVSYVFWYVFAFRALRNGLWPLLNTLSQKEAQLCCPALGSCCLLPVFHPGIKKAYLTCN